jgi:hypothetical protein
MRARACVCVCACARACVRAAGVDGGRRDAESLAEGGSWGEEKCFEDVMCLEGEGRQQEDGGGASTGRRWSGAHWSEGKRGGSGARARDSREGRGEE